MSLLPKEHVVPCGALDHHREAGCVAAVDGIWPVNHDGIIADDLGQICPVKFADDFRNRPTAGLDSAVHVRSPFPFGTML